MTKLMIVITLLMILFDTIYSVFLKNKGFLVLSDPGDCTAGAFGIKTFIAVFVPYVLDTGILKTNSLVYKALFMLVAAFILFVIEIKDKNFKKMVFIPPLILASFITLFLLQEVEYEATLMNSIVYGAAAALFAVVAVIIYGCIKTKTFSVKRPLWQNISIAAASCLIAFAAYYGLSILSFSLPITNSNPSTIISIVPFISVL